MNGGSPSASSTRPAARVGPARGWAVRESAPPQADWASRSGGWDASAASALAAPAGNSLSGLPLFAAATTGATARPSQAKESIQQELMRTMGRSPLASVTAAFSHLQGSVLNAAALLLPSHLAASVWGRTTHTAQGRWNCNNSTPLTKAGLAAPWTAAPFASVTSVAASSSSTFGNAPLAPAAGSSSAAAAAAAAKADVGRATWTLLHSLAAQFPERPTRQQQRDARTLVDCLTRIYPCGDCARHFAELVKRDPPAVSSGPAFRRWLCQVHNRVNARLAKPTFNCDLVESRWAPLGCSAAEAAAGEAGLVPGGLQGGLDTGCDLLGVGARGPQRRRG